MHIPRFMVARLLIGRAPSYASNKLKQLKRAALASVVALAALSVFSASAQVGGPSNDILKADILYTACNPPSDTNQSVRDTAALTCELYFRGLTDGLFLMKAFVGKSNAGCLPTDTPISTAEAEGDFALFLRDHPEARENSAAIVAGFGIMRAHPCP
ncbi:MAG: Rap1a/Tai family immunity protein [Rhizomicrobium sp.]